MDLIFFPHHTATDSASVLPFALPYNAVLGPHQSIKGHRGKTAGQHKHEHLILLPPLPDQSIMHSISATSFVVLFGALGSALAICPGFNYGIGNQQNFGNGISRCTL
jgi:hypothetical protein